MGFLSIFVTKNLVMTAFQRNKNIFFLLFITITALNSDNLQSEPYRQMVSVVVQDAVTQRKLSGADVTVMGSETQQNSVSDAKGISNFMLPPGRYSFRVSFMGYRNAYIKGIVVGSGKEVIVYVDLTEESRQIGQIIVRGENKMRGNSIDAIDAHKLKSEDASRFAGGFYDPLRMVTALPGVSTGNDDDNNQIIIRGNSPRGLQWVLEGIEIPNPNHLSQGEGGTGGAYSMITTNVISGINFYTGAFPAEYGNAFSGVMDLTLKTGNSSKREYSAGLSVVGAELSGEGPVSSKISSSWVSNFRYANFRILERYGILDSRDVSIMPGSFDWAVKGEISASKAGRFSFFSVGGSSEVGDKASAVNSENNSDIDKDQFLDKKFTAIAGISHFILFPNLKTNLKSTLGITYQHTNTEESVIDNNFVETITYNDSFKYPALRFAIQLNHKFNPNSSIRIGFNQNITSGRMFAKKLSGTLYDTLINKSARGNYGNLYIQWHYKPFRFAEFNSGINISFSGITREVTYEPRFGVSFNLSQEQSISFSAGLHSKNEALSIYNYRVAISAAEREERNLELKTIKALHISAGYNLRIDENTRLKLEYYYQNLYNVPQAKSTQSFWSILNYAYGLPDIELSNQGKGINSGLEYSLEHDFTKGFYYLIAGSFFDSKYKAPIGKWFNTYYNNNYVFNLTTGKEFKSGKKRQNTFGFNLKIMSRGGYRYTPVDYDLSISRKRIIYDNTRYYGKRLPAYIRNDFGFSYRVNMSDKSLTIQADIQNFTNRKNIVRTRFSYKNGSIIESSSRSIGLVPLLSIRLDF